MSKRLQEKADKEAAEKASRKFEWKWVEKGGIVHGDAGTTASEKIIAFDMVYFGKIHSELSRMVH